MLNYKRYMDNIDVNGLKDTYMQALQQQKNGTYAAKEGLYGHGLSPEERLIEIERDGFQGSFDYPGGFEQYKKDILSGNYGKSRRNR